MICNRCNETGRLIQYQSFSYYYCDKCKNECFLEVVSKSPDRDVSLKETIPAEAWTINLAQLNTVQDDSTIPFPPAFW